MDDSSHRRRDRPLRIAALVEGLSLTALLLVAVPLKHFGDEPAAVRLLGPVHGLAYIAYVWLLVQTAAAEGWPARRTGRLLLASWLPFGAWLDLQRGGGPRGTP